MNLFDALLLSASFVPGLHERVCIEIVWSSEVLDVCGFTVDLEVSDGHLVRADELGATGGELSFQRSAAGKILVVTFFSSGEFFGGWFSFLKHTCHNDWNEPFNTSLSVCGTVPVQRSINLCSEKIIFWIKLFKRRL